MDISQTRVKFGKLETLISSAYIGKFIQVNRTNSVTRAHAISKVKAIFRQIANSSLNRGQ